MDRELIKAVVKAMEEGKLCIFCGKEIVGYGNNPAPLSEEGRCCDECNYTKVIPARLKNDK